MDCIARVGARGGVNPEVARILPPGAIISLIAQKNLGDAIASPIET